MPQENCPAPVARQKASASPVFATTVAATVESFYRSALNAFINSALLGQKVQRLFPDMHVQAPVRVMYINGIKQSRAWFANNVDPDDYQFSGAVRAGVWCAPGLIMTPISSVLEAANAGNKNPEPLLTQRWLRGVSARAVREVIFAIGVNQMSEAIEERVPEDKVASPLLRNSIGSLTAGVLAGYFSHVPHNMSALKLHYPQKSYGALFREYAKSSEERLPAAIRSETSAMVCALLFPKALVARTVQIMGTFTLLNGIIFLLKDVNPSPQGWGESK
eukprot:TRINITY_DN9230_c0_g1_i1.p1 TRINITY_DN9230_c0_g1~~TRINITY_DN9230_c0_g1_i1.p1  ORF type:complete len:276 (+),score=93.11 TRINITY_DN9230_c0_g1_i1:83-910(+)